MGTILTLPRFTIGLLGCLVWGHHTHNVGFDIDSRAYFTTICDFGWMPVLLQRCQFNVFILLFLCRDCLI